MKILFALNQEKETSIEEMILASYKNITNNKFTFSKEYDLSSVSKKLDFEFFNLLVINEELERDNTVTTTFIDDITDKFKNLRVVLIVKSEHDKDFFIKRLFNLGVYDILYAHDITIEGIANLIANARSKAETKIYLDLHDIDDVRVEKELRYIPEEQLNNILDFFDKTPSEDLPKLYEHIYSQYNQIQMVFLHRYLSDEIKKVLKGNKYFEEIELKAKDYVYDEINGYMADNIEYEEETIDTNKKSIIPNISINLPKAEISIIDNKTDSVRAKLLGSVLIGVANSVRGTGASFVSLSLGRYLKSMGFSVAILELNEYPSFINLAKDKSKSYINFKGIDIYYISKNKTNNAYNIPEFYKTYEYVISDLGIIKSYENGTFINNPGYQEFIRCNVKLLVISGQQWKWGEIYPFLVNEKINNWNLLITPTNKKMKSLIKRELSNYTKKIFLLPYCDKALKPNDELNVVYNKVLKGFIETKKRRFNLPTISFKKQGE